MHEQQSGRARTLAYVVMPDHLHWLMRLGDVAPLSHVVRSVKSVTSHHVGRPIWQTGFHDHALRRDEDLVRAGRYVIANPLRAGLVTHINDDSHWDAIWFMPDGQAGATPW